MAFERGFKTGVYVLLNISSELLNVPVNFQKVRLIEPLKLLDDYSSLKPRQKPKSIATTDKHIKQSIADPKIR